jgi:peptidoglycan-associated lipoprotein
MATTAAVAIALALAGCAGDRPKEAAAPTPRATPPASTGVTNMQPAIVPNTPTASNVSISDEVLRACNIPDRNAYFPFDSSKLTDFDLGPLDAVATCFASGPLKGRKMSLVGHADPRGASEYNLTLGQARADAVLSYLAGRGLSRASVTTSSRGAMDATGTDETGWAHDRRVDVLVAKQSE